MSYIARGGLTGCVTRPEAGSKGSLALNTTADTASCLPPPPFLAASSEGGAQICQFRVAVSTWLEGISGSSCVWGPCLISRGAKGAFASVVSPWGYGVSRGQR